MPVTGKGLRSPAGRPLASGGSLEPRCASARNARGPAGRCDLPARGATGSPPAPG